MTNDPQHEKKEEEEEQVQLPEEVRLFELEKMEEEQARKDVKQNIDTELSPPPETETGNSVNGSVKHLWMSQLTGVISLLLDG